MAKFDLKGYARRGAEARLTELQQELDAIYAAFPDLRGGHKGGQVSRGVGVGRSSVTSAAESSAPTVRRRRPKMTAAQRKAVSERMRKYWAGRRKAKAAK